MYNSNYVPIQIFCLTDRKSGDWQLQRCLQNRPCYTRSGKYWRLRRLLQLVNGAMKQIQDQHNGGVAVVLLYSFPYSWKGKILVWYSFSMFLVVHIAYHPQKVVQNICAKMYSYKKSAQGPKISFSFQEKSHFSKSLVCLCYIKFFSFCVKTKYL